MTGIWFSAAERGHAFGAFRVPSKLNIADAGTRMADKVSELQALREAGFVRVAWAWPDGTPGLRARAH
mgnify:CR=1 FL=1